MIVFRDDPVKAGRAKGMSGSTPRGGFRPPSLKGAAAIITLLLLFNPGPLPAADPGSEEPMGGALQGLAEGLPSLDLTRPPSPSADALAYFQRYGLHFPGIDHYFGSFESGDYRIAAHVFLPETPRGTVFVLHGYLDHTGVMQKLIEALLEGGFAVAVHDFPGHGLSTGKKAYIDDFSKYVTALEDFIHMGNPILPKPFHLIGQSTGSAVALEYLFTAGPSTFEKVILLSPLVRSVYWTWARIGQSLADPFVDEIPRAFRENSSDPAYQEFIRNDPLQSRKVSLKWVKALQKWEERIQTYGMIPHRVMIIQGTEDDVVDWRYNLPFLMGKVEVDTAILINGARHQLTNERDELRHAVLEWITKYLEEKRR